VKAQDQFDMTIDELTDELCRRANAAWTNLVMPLGAKR
jgi:hypothetical protein